MDRNLVNGVTYHYKLEDIETTGKTEMHGPVSATPRAGAGTCCEDSTEKPTEEALITVGRPEQNHLTVREGRRGEVVLELVTGGFYAEPLDDGSVKIEVPGYELKMDPGYPSLPVKRSWVEAIAGRKVKLISVKAFEKETFEGLRPVSGEPVVEASLEGTVRAGRKRKAIARKKRGIYPRQSARVVSVGYQEDVKKALVEMAPLRWNGRKGKLVLAHRLVVRLAFKGRDPADKVGKGRQARRYRKQASHEKRRVVGRLVTKEKGLYGVSYKEVFKNQRRRGIRASSLRLSRQGEPVAFHLGPDTRRFRPGVTLYFLSDGSAANPYGDEAVYELETGVSGERMSSISAAPSGAPVSYYWETVEKEENLLYQPALVEAPDRWLWSMLFAPARESFPFEVSWLAPTAEPSHLEVWLQGASDFEADPDHHVRLFVNGVFVGEASWDGKHAEKIEAELLAGILREGTNHLEIENVGDTGASYSMVILNRYRMSYPRTAAAVEGRLEGRWSVSGTTEVFGLNPQPFIIELREDAPIWLTGMESAMGVVRFRAEAGARYLVTSPEAVLPVEVRKPVKNRLKRKTHRADYVVIGPRSFVAAAGRLLELRRSQGLGVKGVVLEEVYSEFGFGEETPKAIQDFLSYAYHHWRKAPRYVLLLGDGTYDFKDELGTGVVNQVPPMMAMTTYMETASDPAYAAVNGEDILPDLAIGRLPAATVDELQKMIAKVLAFETSGRTLGGGVVLVTDNPDEAGDFVSNAEELASTVLSARQLEKIYLSDLGRAAARSEIQQAFNDGSSLMSYIGHGGIHLWADENILNIYDTSSLTTQSEQPLVLTMNCLNGYFHFPYFSALAEELLKVEGKGAIAAFSPSGLSLNEAAHVFHRVLLDELLHGNHLRLGDAVLAAQAAYAESGAFPELLSIYHLLGDPALRFAQKQ
jgi:hypothetical protein